MAVENELPGGIRDAGRSSTSVDVAKEVSMKQFFRDQLNEGAVLIGAIAFIVLFLLAVNFFATADPILDCWAFCQR